MKTEPNDTQRQYSCGAAFCQFCCCERKIRGGTMSVSLIFKIAAVGILVTILNQVLKHSGREEHAFLISLAGLILVLTWIIPYIYDLFIMVQELFTL